MRYIIALAGFLAGCGASPSTAPAAERDISVLDVVASPDGSKSAVAYSDMGGGAAGWCYVCVDVVAGHFNPRGAACGQKQQWFRCSTEINLVWRSPTEVLANYEGQPVTGPELTQDAATLPDVSIRYEAAR